MQPEQPPASIPEIPLDLGAIMQGPDLNVVMADQLLRNLALYGLEALVQGLIFGGILYVVLRLNDRRL